MRNDINTYLSDIKMITQMHTSMEVLNYNDYCMYYALTEP